ncbi:flagellar hook-basal body complex protein [Chitinibacteraceae bacterium HSL-7]
MSINSILIASGAMSSYTKGLSTISDNISNLNTTAYKGKRLSFYEQPGQDNATLYDRGAHYGGVTTGTMHRLYSQGDIQKTGSTYDLAIRGEGYFLLQGKRGIEYTRAGAFVLDQTRSLVQQGSGKALLVYGLGGELQPVVLGADLNIQKGKATTKIEFGNIINSNSTIYEIPEAFSVYTDQGDATQVKLSLAADPLESGRWVVTLKASDGGAQVLGSGSIKFLPDGNVDPAAARIDMDFKPADKSAQKLTLDFSKVLLLSTLSNTISLDRQDGLAAGQLNAVTISQDGEIEVGYSNGNTMALGRIALASIGQPDLLRELEYGVFDVDGAPIDIRVAAAGSEGLGQVEQGALEASNVELTKQFSSLIVAQRGYQAASQVISTTNEMLGLLFDIRGKR